MPLYIPWLTETIKKRGVRYLLHHYLGQFFLEKLTLDQLSIDIYEGKGSIKNLALDVDGLNDELDFIPFKFLEGCSIGQISVEVPWSSLSTEACRVELDGAEFVCRLKTSSDTNKAHCTESTLLNRSLMTSSMQMAEDIVTKDDDDDCESPVASVYQPHSEQANRSRKQDANQMFEGLEMFAQLIDSVLRRTKLTARNTLFRIQPIDSDNSHESSSSDDAKLAAARKQSTSTTSDSYPMSAEESERDDDSETCSDSDIKQCYRLDDTVEFFIKFFRCEEIMDQSKDEEERGINSCMDEPKSAPGILPETVTKLLTLEDVELRIGGRPVSNLTGKHTIMIKFNGQKSEISIYSGSPLLAVIGHEQLKTFFNVFDSAKVSATSDNDNTSSPSSEKDQKMMSSEDYAKIENQLLNNATLRKAQQQMAVSGSVEMSSASSSRNSDVTPIARHWLAKADGESMYQTVQDQEGEFEFHVPTGSNDKSDAKSNEALKAPTLQHIEAFSCELKLPGIWLCIIKSDEVMPAMIKPYADSINSFHTIHKYIDQHIKMPHVRCLALKVALNMTSAGINVFLGDLDISEHFSCDNQQQHQQHQDNTAAMLYPRMHILRNDTTLANNTAHMSSPRYKASIRLDEREISIELLTKTRVMFDPTMIDRIICDYKLIDAQRACNQKAPARHKVVERKSQAESLKLNVSGKEFKVELLCPIPDLTPQAHTKRTELRPQSFIFNLHDIVACWHMDTLNVSALGLTGWVKTQPKQLDNAAVKFIESTSKSSSDRITLTLEPSPSSLDDGIELPNEIEQALNESSMYDSIYVGNATESRLPTQAFQTRRKVVGKASGVSSANARSKLTSNCDNERIIAPGDRQHLLDYLAQTVKSTKFSLNVHLPICEVEFEDKEQLDLIYNRFGNDFVFWQPKAFDPNASDASCSSDPRAPSKSTRRKSNNGSETGALKFRRPDADLRTDDDQTLNDDDDDEDSEGLSDAHNSDVSFHSLSEEAARHVSDIYDNEVTCKVTIDQVCVRFNHQSCAAALKQEITAEKFLLGVLVDVGGKPNIVVSMVGDSVELATDENMVLVGNPYCSSGSAMFALTAEIKRPSKTLKDIKLAIQLANALFSDFKIDTFTRFWQSINVTDEPIAGYVAPKIVTELHVDVINTALSLARAGARPALACVDELYVTSMVVESTSQAMIRLIADEASLYLKRNKQGLEVMKNYICLIDTGLIDVNIKIGRDGQLEFSVINNVINVRVCQDSLSALCKLITVLIRNSAANSSSNAAVVADVHTTNAAGSGPTTDTPTTIRAAPNDCEHEHALDNSNVCSGSNEVRGEREMDLLLDAMNDYSEKQKLAAEMQRLNSNLSDNSDESTDKKHGFSACDDDDDDDDCPPNLQEASGDIAQPGACLLDESNPLLGELFSQPLTPAPVSMKTASRSSDDECEDSNVDCSLSASHRAVDESGFFVIGDDDIGAGIIDKAQSEPIVRKLIDGPIHIIDNHFRMKTPRTLPEILANSFERYALEEMTLVVNLFGGRDFEDDDEDDMDDEETNNDQFADTAPTDSTASNSMSALNDDSFDFGDTKSASSTRSRNDSSSAANQKRNQPRKHCAKSDSISSLMKSSSHRRKHLSEGAHDSRSAEQRVRFGDGASVNLWESLDLMAAPELLGTAASRRGQQTQHRMSADSKLAGGTLRQQDVCIQLTLTKMKLLYESASAPEGASPPVSWRFMLYIQDIEVRDRIQASDINMMLYEYCNESMPKRNTQMLSVKNVATINPSDGCEECDLRVSLKPLRLNIDQDTLLFLIEFFSALNRSLNRQQQQQQQQQSHAQQQQSFAAGKRSQAPQSRANDVSPCKHNARPSPDDGTPTCAMRSRGSSMSSTNSLVTAMTSQSPHKSSGCNTTTTTTTTNASEAGDDALPTHCHADGAASQTQQSIYIKSFTFSPDVPIRLDYHAKHLDFDQGALAGILMGLAHLDHSELVLRRVQAKHGMRGLDRVLVFTMNAWINDIKRNQLPSILSGVGPMHSVIQLFQGMRDLVWMPIDHYRKDRRLVRGLQRGASSFSSSTAMAAINLMNRFISIVQCTAQFAHDIVTPPTPMLLDGGSGGGGGGGGSAGSASERRRRRLDGGASTTSNDKAGRSRMTGGVSSASAHRRYATSSCDNRHHHHNSGGGGSHAGTLNQPRNFCEGVAVGFSVLKDGFSDTARNVAIGMQADDMRSVVGELVRQIPSTLLNPIISATEGAQNVLVGIRNQITPDARREDQEKWKRRVRGK